jgi:hypothetical protein
MQLKKMAHRSPFDRKAGLPTDGLPALTKIDQAVPIDGFGAGQYSSPPQHRRLPTLVSISSTLIAIE